MILLKENLELPDILNMKEQLLLSIVEESM